MVDSWWKRMGLVEAVVAEIWAINAELLARRELT
jgi:hypothetical protein